MIAVLFSLAMFVIIPFLAVFYVFTVKQPTDDEIIAKILEVKPQIHVFGHIHHSYGEKLFNGTHFVNASICNERYQPLNKPIEVEV